MHTVRNTLLAFAFLVVAFAPTTHARAATVEEMLTQIQTLMAQIETLQKQLATMKGEVRTVIKEGLQEGMTDADIKKLQELLATDPTIYPEGKVTGYFGPLTKEAVKRFQMRHELTTSGVIDAETHDFLEEYFGEMYGDKIPPGLLRSPGIAKKVEMRLELKCESKKGMGPLCKKLKVKHGSDDDDDDANDDDDSSDHEGDYKAELTYRNGTTTVRFEYAGKDYIVKVGSSEEDDILDAIADKLDIDRADLDADFVDEIKTELDDINDEIDDKEAADDADNAIEDAEDAIDAAEKAIDDATGDTADAEDLLKDAQDKLDDAKKAYDDEDWSKAEDLAKEAEDLAGEAEDAL